MKTRKIISAALGAAMAVSAFTGFSGLTASAAAKQPQYQETAREMEKLNRGLIAVKTTADTREQTKNGVVLSWRLLGDESLADTAFEVYRNNITSAIATIKGGEATYYFDPSGTETSKYKVVKVGASDAEKEAEPWVTPTTTWACAKGNEVGNGNSNKHSFTWVDIPISMPVDIPHANTTALSNYKRNSDGAGGANDASIGDLDGDGDYEIVLKWDPVDSRDAAGTTTTGRCILDAYEIDPNNGGKYMWRIDLGNNITAGAHSTQFMVYDFDGDGKAEIATQTAEGSYSINSSGEKHFVTEVGDTEEIRNGDNNATHLSRGKNIGADYLTIFDGETGTPLKTTAGIPLGSANGSDWGDSKLNRSSRYLAAVAYLDGVHPSFIAIRGMYNKTVIRAYNWDGEDLSLLWEHNGNKKGSTMYGQGNHNLNIADIDEDGKDEIVYGSACLDDDGKTVMGNTLLGHGDAMHTSDFNNDGVQEVFSVKEDSEGFKEGEQLRVAKTGKTIWSKSVTSDNGRGLMGNIDDAYASTHPDALALGWDAAHAEAYDLKGNAVGAKPSSAGKGDFCNFLVYWDGDLSSELLDANIIQKYDAANGWTKRFYGPSDGYTLSGTTNNDSKRNYSLVADLWGDWREEIIMPVDDSTPDAPKLRIFTSITPTDYRLTTLMHDSQYRTAIAWQNVGYNQPPHTSYYIGSAALATDESGKTLKYLAPAVPYTRVKYPSTSIEVPVTGITLSESSISIEKGSSVTVQANITPDNADKKGVRWESDNTGVATVSNGIITGVGNGTTTITATAKDTTNGVYSAQCTVEVHSTPVTGITFPARKDMTIMNGASAVIEAGVEPADATDKVIHWSSTNENVVKVDSTGTVTGVAQGSAIVRAITNDGGYTDEMVVTVSGQKSDKTGSNAFTKTGEGNGTTISTSATSASITQKDAAAGASVQKEFEVIGDNQTKVSFKFNTGGQRVDGGSSGSVNWTGHEYTFGLQFLDENDKNILTLSQAHTTGAQATQSIMLDEEAKTAANDWTKTVDKGNSPFGRSMSTWTVEMEFNYNDNTAHAVVTGGGGEGDVFEKTFELNGAKFAKLKLYTTKDNDNATVTVSPSISGLSYTYEVPTDGVGKNLYDKGTYENNKWTSADISDWTVTGGAPLEFDSANNRIWFHPTKPGAAYSATKKFEVSDNALVTYDADWFFGGATGRDSNLEYIQIGSKLRIGHANSTDKGYFTYVSTDGGTTWNDLDNDGSPDSIYGGDKADQLKNVHVVIDTATKTILSLKFDNTEVSGYSGYKLADDTAFNEVSFGFQRGGGTNDGWVYPCGINNLTVLQFVEGETPVVPTPTPTAAPTPSATPAPTATPTVPPAPEGEFKVTVQEDKTVSYGIIADTEVTDLTVIGAMYKDGVLQDVKIGENYDKIEAGQEITGTIEFGESIGDNDVKLFAWDMGNLRSLFNPAIPAKQ